MHAEKSKRYQKLLDQEAMANAELISREGTKKKVSCKSRAAGDEVGLDKVIDRQYTIRGGVRVDVVGSGAVTLRQLLASRPPSAQVKTQKV